MRKIRTTVTVLLSLAVPAGAATYYVDFEGGRDAADGLSPATAFKRCPGDAAATDIARAVKLAPGDTVLFKAGTIYRGSVRVSASGSEGKPIVFDGNTAGAYGEGRAVIDGSEPVTGWARCSSADEAGGSPNWRSIYAANIPKGPTPFTINLTQGDRSYAIAQDPNPGDLFWEDVVGKWHLVAAPQPAVETPNEIVPGSGMAENSSRAFRLAFDGNSGSSAVLDPVAGAELTIRLKGPVAVTGFGIELANPRYYHGPKDIVLLADGKEALKATLKFEAGLQKLALPVPVTFRELTLKVLSADVPEKVFGALAELQAYDAAGTNVLLTPSVTVYRDDTYFTQADARFWDGGYFVLHGRPNLIYYQKMVSFDPATHTVRFETLNAGQYPVGGSTPGRFSMMNAPGILDRPGEFVLDERPRADGTLRLYVWPFDAGKGTDGICSSARDTGFSLANSSFVTVRGFRIERQGGRDRAFGVTGAGGANVLIEDNEATLIRAARNQVIGYSDGTSVTVTKNRIWENRRAGAIALTRCKDSLISDNVLHKNGATALLLYTCERTKVIRNILTEHKGMHANGLTAYLGNREVVFHGNRVSGGNVGLTMQDGANITVSCNIIDGGGSQMCVGLWNTDNLANVRIVNNVLIRSAPGSTWVTGIYANKGKKAMEGYVIRNNVIDGTCLEQGQTVDRANNVYTRRGWTEMAERDWKPGPGEVLIEDLSKLFADPAKGDWRPKRGGPLVDAGADVGLTEDIAGTKVPQGRAPDIGAFEAVRER